MTTDVMIDIETLGTRPGSVILEIAAVAFDVTNPETRHAAIVNTTLSIEGQSALGATSDVDTLLWWTSDPMRARHLAAIRAEGAHHGPETLMGTCMKIAMLLEQDRPRIWAFSPNFDCVLIENLLHRLHIPVPWSHRQLRDLRTLAMCAGAEKLNDVIPYPTAAHRALIDAAYQAQCAIALWARIKNKELS